MDYDTDMLERVRDECGDFLKSLEMDFLAIRKVPSAEINEGVTESVHNTVVREISPINSKQSLDKNAKMARLRSQSHSKEDCRAAWDPHHTHCTQDTMHSLRQENHVKQIQIAKLSQERDQLKKRIIELKLEIQNLKEKNLKRA